MIQGPHCLVDFSFPERDARSVTADAALDVVSELINTLMMKPKNEPRLVRGGPRNLSIYQIISTSHIIIHFSKRTVNADLFSCEPFDVDKCVSVLTRAFGEYATVQYCQRNLMAAPKDTQAIPMRRLNRLTSDPQTLTHAMINFYSGDRQLLNDVEHGTAVLRQALGFLAVNSERDSLPTSDVLLLDVEPVPESWDQGGFSGGYVNLSKQLTIHTFAGQDGAYSDVMARVFDIEAIVETITQGFAFRYYEVDGIFQRPTPHLR